MRIAKLIALLTIVVPVAFVRSAPPEAVNLRRTVVVDVAERTKDAVVYISTRTIVSQRISSFGNGDPFWERFGPSEVRRVPGGSLGSGFIIHPDGYIVTNNHVVDRAREIEVELLDGRKLKANIVSTDPEADLAILKIDSDKPLPTLDLGDSSDLLVGEPVIAVGNPFGFSHSVSSGIVSALHRDLKGTGEEEEQVLLGDLIQTDAAINPGNSGGPLLNAYGQVIGINTAIRGDAQNIGFAIPVNKLRDLIPALLTPQQVSKLDVPIKFEEKRKLTEPATIETTVVRADDGEGKGAVVESIAGQKPRDIIDAYAILLRQKENEKFTVKFADGKTVEISPHASPEPDAIVQARDKLGLTVEELTPPLAQKYGLIDDEGMLITAVDRNSSAAKSGVKSGDVIIALGRYPVHSLKEFSSLMQLLPNADHVLIGIARGRDRGYLNVKL